MGGKPFQSKLLPYSSEIMGYRIQGISYQKIAEILKHDFDIEVDPSTIFSFVKSRSKRRKKVISMLEENVLSITKENLLPGIISKNLKQEERIQRQTAKADDEDFIFDFNPDEPLY